MQSGVSNSTSNPELLQRAMARWESELLEIGGSSDLLSLDLSSDGLLDLATAHPSGLAAFLAGRSTRLSDLFRADNALRQARYRARALCLASARLVEVYGLPGAQLATGVFSWDDAPGGPVRAPVLLRPITLTAHGAGAGADFDLEPAEVARLNPALLALLDAQGLLIGDDEVVGADHAVAARTVLERFSRSVASLGATVTDRTLIGAFSDVGPGLVSSLRALREQIVRHRTVAALLKKPVAAESVSKQVGGNGLSWKVVAERSEAAPAPQLAPRSTLLDPAQQRVLTAVAAGSDARVAAANGAGVTTVAAAIVEQVAARGGRVLVVAPVLSELADLRQELSQDLRAVAIDHANRVSAHQAMHTVHPVWGLSRFEVLTRLASYPIEPHGEGPTLPHDTLVALAADRKAAGDLLADADRAGAFAAPETAWQGANLPDAAAATAALAVVQQLLDRDLPAARMAMTRVALAVGLPEGLSVTEWAAHIEVLSSVRATQDVMTPEVYERANEEMVMATASSNWRAAHNVTMSMLDRRRWKREAAALVRPGIALADLNAALLRARLEVDLWKRLGGTGTPKASPDLDEASAAFTAVREGLAELEPVLAGSAVGGSLNDLSVDELSARLQALADGAAQIETLPYRARALAQLDRAGLGALVSYLGAGSRLTNLAGAEISVRDHLEIAWLRGVLADLGPASQAWSQKMPQPRASVGLPEPIAEALTLVTSMALGQLPTNARYDTVLLLDAHGIGLAEGVLAISRGEQTVLIGDPAGLGPGSLDLGVDVSDTVRASTLTATAGRLPEFALDRVHRQPARLAELVARLSCDSAVAPAWSVAAPPAVAGSDLHDELEFVHVPGSTVPQADRPSVPIQEVEQVVAVIADHARTRPQESLAVLTLTRELAVEINEVLRQSLRRSPDLADWVDDPSVPPLIVTDLWHVDEVERDRVVLSLGLARDSFGRFNYRFGPLDTEAGANLIGLAIGRAAKRFTVVSSLWPDDISGSELSTPGAKRALALLQLAAGSGTSSGASGALAHPPEADPAQFTPLFRDLIQMVKAGPSAAGARHDRDPDLIGGGAALLWDGYSDAGPRRDLACALSRFGWRVAYVSADWVATARKRRG